MINHLEFAGKRPYAVLAVLIVIVLLAACTGAPVQQPAEQPVAEEPAVEQPAAEEPAAETGEEAAEAPAAEEPAAEEPAAEAGEEAAEAPAAEEPAAEAETSDVCQGMDGGGMRVGFGNLGESVPFAVQVREGIEEVAETCNVELLPADNALDPQIAIDNARLFMTQEADGIIMFNVHGNIADSICEIVGDTPMIAVDIAHEGCSVFMGANNRMAGELAGQAAGEVAREMWNCEIDAVVTHEAPGVGQVNIDRLNGLIAGLASVCPDNDYGDFESWSMDPVGIITRLDSDRVDPSYQKGRDYLTANQDKQRIVSLCINDDSCLGMLAAVQEAGRQDQVIFASQGADPSVWSEIRTNPMYAGSTAYFPELYGTYLIPNIIKMVQGEEVEGPILLDHVAITADNIDQYYPEE